MNLRPATPLSILFFAAFVLLLLSTLSTPIIKAIPLANYDGVDYGVFGYCKGSDCSGMGIGYTTSSDLFSDSSDGEFDLPSGARHTLSAILVVHPVAAFLTLICFGLSVAAHFHSPGHSPRYLMGLMILAIPTLLVSLLAFLVDILLFVPHMQWGGWIVLAATVIIFCCGLVTCAMRRTLVSRKSRKKRIAENAEMNGETYYNSRPPPPDMVADPTMVDTLPRADSPPPLTHQSMSPHSMAAKGPEFATFELQKKSMDDSTPLNQRSYSMKSASTSGGRSNYSEPSYYGEQPPPLPSGAAGRARPPPMDMYGNPIPMGRSGPPMRGGMGPGRGGGMPFPNGRGRGGAPPRGGPRGGYRGPRGPPPPGWAGNGRGMAPGPPPMGMAGGAMMGRGQRGPPPGYQGYDGYSGGGPGYGQPPAPYGAAREISQEGAAQLGVLPEPNSPIGQAIEMDGRAGTPSNYSSGNQNVNNYGLRDSDGDLQGMIGMQQGRLVPPPRLNTASPLSPTSVYSQETSYVAPRPHWINHQSAAPPPLYHETSDNTMPSSNSRGLSPIEASPASSPVELPAQLAQTPRESYYDEPERTPTSPQMAPATKTVTNTSDNYYEDIEPRFAEPSHPLPTIPSVSDDNSNRPSIAASSVVLPSGLTPGFANTPPRSQNSSPNPVTLRPGPLQTHPMSAHNQFAHHHPDDDDLAVPEGARSPAASDTSHFTSISQRGVNPAWRPPPGQAGFGGMPMGMGMGMGMRPPPRQQDVLLEANPDFGLPGLGPPTRGRRGGLRGGMRGRGGAATLGTQPQGIGSVPVGRYPVPDALN